MSAGIKITGVDATMKKLDRFSGSVRRKIIRKAVRVGGKVHLDTAKQMAPRGTTGLFRRSMRQVVRSYAKKGVFISIVGQQKDKHFSDKAKAVAARKTGGLSGGISGTGRVVPIHLVDQPTKPHRILSNSASEKPMAFLAGGSVRFARTVDHPGTAGHRFMERAESSSRQRARAAFTEEAKRGITAEARKA